MPSIFITPRAAKCRMDSLRRAGQLALMQREAASPSSRTILPAHTGHASGMRKDLRSEPCDCTRTTLGITSPLRSITTVSPICKPSRSISSSLCSVARDTVTPLTSTGFRCATGVSASVERNAARRYHSQRLLELLQPLLMAASALTGLAASPGTYVGRALVAERPDALLGRTTEVLVVRSASMEWLEAISRAGAVVTEIGGKTSHAATICRALGKPCVTAVASVTFLIRSGALVAVDGGAGTVTVLD